jgi:Skp family chaperone for outer membrane proteins
MWNMKNVMLFVASLVAVILISISMASADEKTITPKEFGNAIAQTPGKFVNFISNEVDKTKEYQKKSWAEMKTKWPFNMLKGKSND